MGIRGVYLGEIGTVEFSVDRRSLNSLLQGAAGSSVQSALDSPASGASMST